MRSTDTTGHHHHYHQWLARVHGVARAFHEGRIAPDDLKHFQRHILEFGEFNANFTLDELAVLDYPKSPFSIRGRHAYIRSTETWATEILREMYRKTHDTALHDYMVFIDSDKFWTAIPGDTRLVYSKDMFAEHPDNNFKNMIVDSTARDVWVCVDEDHKKEETAKLIRQIVVEHAIRTKVPAALQAAFLRPEHEYTDDEKRLMDDFLKSGVAYYTELKITRYQSLHSNQNRNKGWYGKVFQKLRNIDHPFLRDNKVTGHKELQRVALEQSQLFEEIYQSLESDEPQVVDKSKNDNIYGQAILGWIKEETSLKLTRYFYYKVPQEKFMGLDTLVLLGHKEAESSDGFGPKSLINRLGYRIEPRTAVTALLQKYPLLFVDQEQTSTLWQQLLATPLLKAIPEERDAIEKLYQSLFKIPQKAERVNYKSECDYFIARECDGVFGFYQAFIVKYLAEFQKQHPEGSVVYDILMPEIVQSLKHFIDAYTQTGECNLPAAIRAVQAIAEILRLDLAMAPMDEDELITNAIRTKLLKDYPVQQVAMTPYGMRAYLRVVQASKLATASNARPKIFVTNQNYFEWLLHLGHIEAGQVDVTHIRQLEDIDRSADYIFAEIHPNNATEKNIFSQNLKAFLLRMTKEGWNDKQRTLVFDATLNALDGKEMCEVLDAARPLVEAGKLNIIIMQSLTKFSQIGLDERCGGLSIIINDGKSWQKHNANYKAIVDSEPADKATLQYFSYFFNNGRQHEGKPSLTIKYIHMINTRVILLYQEILERLRPAGFENQKYFQLTTSSDSSSCYLSFNTAGILAAIDTDFKIKSADIELFCESIVKELLIPLCRKVNLPITGRMSIAFPLSSANTAADSIRFTVGLESLLELKQYAKIIAYIAHAINYTLGLEALFEKNAAGKYNKRSEVFKRLALGEHVLTLRKMSGARRINHRNLYGPYTHRGQNIYILHDGNEISCHIQGGQHYQHREIALLQANIATGVSALSAEYLDYFLRGSGLGVRADINPQLQKMLKIKGKINTHYVPLKSDRTEFMFTSQGIAIEKDYNSNIKHGLTIMMRAFTSKLTVIEMAYWQEKDVDVSRFITFAIAQYVRIRFGAEFKARGDKDTNGSMYNQFLFKLTFEDADHYFSHARDVVCLQKPALLEVLRKHQALPAKGIAEPSVSRDRHAFDDKFDTSIFDGPSQFDHPDLVEAIIKILGMNTPIPPRPASVIKSGFFKPIAESSSSAESHRPDKTDRPDSNM